MLKDTSERLRMNNKESNNVYFKNPFQVGVEEVINIKGLNGTEEIVKIRKKLGDEKFEMAMQMYSFFESALDKLITDENGMSSMTDEQTTRIIDQLQMEVMSLKNQLAVLENKVNVEM